MPTRIRRIDRACRCGNHRGFRCLCDSGKTCRWPGEGSATLKILFDRNIERNAITHRSVVRPRSVRWGDRDATVDVLARQAFPPRGDEEFRIEQMPFLATVTEPARAGQLELFTSFELQMERMRRRGLGQGYFGLDLLEGITLGKVRPPV